jgi:hypothetical protein
MFRIFYAEKDATLYESVPTLNTGLDEILEVGKRLSTSGEYTRSRSILKFDINEITDTLSKYSVDINSCKFVLQLFTPDAKSLPAEYTMEARLVADNWINGTGFENSSPSISNGVTWQYPISGSSWSTAGDITSNIKITGSLGGSWLYTTGSVDFSITGSEQFSYRNSDVNIVVSDMVNLWISGSDSTDIANNGFLLKFSQEDETASTLLGMLDSLVEKLILYMFRD